MEENENHRKWFRLFQGAVYVTVLLDFLVFIIFTKQLGHPIALSVIGRIANIGIYQSPLYSKFATVLMLIVVSIATKSRKDLYLDVYKSIYLPLLLGVAMFFGSFFFYVYDIGKVENNLSFGDWAYLFLSLIGCILIHIALDNISKSIKSGFMKDKYNVENESFQQTTVCESTQTSVNIPMLFYYNKKVQKGWINIVNVFRGALVIGIPESGKSFGFIIPYIKQLIAKGFTALVYDYQFPALGKITYYHYLLAKQKNKKLKFHVVNLDKVEKSKRVNPFRKEYLSTLAEASETAEALVEALKKSDRSTGGGSEQFFNQSAINFLASVIYYFARFEGGKYSYLSHVLLFLNKSYEEIFTTLYSEPELVSLLSPFKSAYDKKAWDQLEGQIGTLKINVSRLATKESIWVFSGDDINLKISDQNEPSILVLANSPDTENITGSCYSVILNRVIRLINHDGNLPCAIIVDELPTIYFHKISRLMGTARKYKVAVLLALQELPQLRTAYGKDGADTIISIVGNVFSGAARFKDTLEWLEMLFGKVKQLKTGLSIDRSRTTVSLNEHMEVLIPKAKIANLKRGEMVGQAADSDDDFTGQHKSSSYHCKISLDMKEIAAEEKLYVDVPEFYNFYNEIEKDRLLRENLIKVNEEVDLVIKKTRGNIIK